MYTKKNPYYIDISNSMRLICTIFRHFVINTRQISCVRMADADSIELLSHSIVPFSLYACVWVCFFDLLRLTHWSNKGSFSIEYFFASSLAHSFSLPHTYLFVSLFPKSLFIVIRTIYVCIYSFRKSSNMSFAIQICTEKIGERDRMWREREKSISSNTRNWFNIYTSIFANNQNV